MIKQIYQAMHQTLIQLHMIFLTLMTTVYVILSESVLVKLNASAEDMVSDDSEQEMDNEGQNSRYTAPSGREWFEVIAQGNSGRAAARNIFLPSTR